MCLLWLAQYFINALLRCYTPPFASHLSIDRTHLKYELSKKVHVETICFGPSCFALQPREILYFVLTCAVAVKGIVTADRRHIFPRAID